MNNGRNLGAGGWLSQAQQANFRSDFSGIMRVENILQVLVFMSAVHEGIVVGMSLRSLHPDMSLEPSGGFSPKRNRSVAPNLLFAFVLEAWKTWLLRPIVSIAVVLVRTIISNQGHAEASLQPRLGR